MMVLSDGVIWAWRGGSPSRRTPRPPSYIGSREVSFGHFIFRFDFGVMQAGNSQAVAEELFCEKFVFVRRDLYLHVYRFTNRVKCCTNAKKVDG